MIIEVFLILNFLFSIYTYLKLNYLVNSFQKILKMEIEDDPPLKRVGSEEDLYRYIYEKNHGC